MGRCPGQLGTRPCGTRPWDKLGSSLGQTNASDFWIGVLLPNLPTRIFVCLLKVVTCLLSLPSELATKKSSGCFGCIRSRPGKPNQGPKRKVCGCFSHSHRMLVQIRPLKSSWFVLPELLLSVGNYLSSSLMGSLAKGFFLFFFSQKFRGKFAEI